MELLETSTPVAECPVCVRSFRPRSLSRAWDSVLAHVSARSRQGCWAHQQLHSALHKRGSRRQAGCPGCPEVFECVSDACLHLHTSYDYAHSRFSSDDEVWRETAARLQTHPPSGDINRQHSSHPGTEGNGGANDPPEPGQELYGLAKAGDEEGVCALLESGMDPNLGGEDGYTPLMTAAESGHSGVVSLLANHPSCRPNLQNTYGQTALALAAQNGHRSAVQELLAAQGGAAADAEVLCGSFTAAELARRAGHGALADEMAEQGREKQLRVLIEALTSGSASGAFDSLGARIAALGVAAGLDPEVAAAALDDPDDIMDWRPPCSVCMDRDVQMALTPCFHACFCAVCAIAIREEGAACPICRCGVEGTQPIFL